jgi:hypothetical protein
LLQRDHPRVYKLAGAPWSWEGRLLAAQMWLGPRAFVSHRAAAALWKLDGIERGPIELTLAHGMRPSAKGVHIHRSTKLPASDGRVMSPFWITGIERTLIDLGGVVSETHVEEALESALFQRLTTVDRLADRRPAPFC